MTYILIADLIKYFHIFIIIYVITGFIITPIQYLHFYLLFIILIFLDWNDFDGQCILTKLEFYFRNNTNNTNNTNNKSVIEGGPQFFRPLFNSLFNTNLNIYQADRLNNFLFMICFLLGFIRLIYYYKIL